jgi:hypothetical protein
MDAPRLLGLLFAAVLLAPLVLAGAIGLALSPVDLPEEG